MCIYIYIYMDLFEKKGMPPTSPFNGETNHEPWELRLPYFQTNPTGCNSSTIPLSPIKSPWQLPFSLKKLQSLGCVPTLNPMKSHHKKQPWKSQFSPKWHHHVFGSFSQATADSFDTSVVAAPLVPPAASLNQSHNRLEIFNWQTLAFNGKNDFFNGTCDFIEIFMEFTGIWRRQKNNLTVWPWE